MHGPIAFAAHGPWIERRHVDSSHQVRCYFHGKATRHRQLFPPSHHPCGNAVLVRGFVCFCGIKRGAIGKWICGRPRFSSISSFQVGNISCVLRLFGATFNQDTVIEVGVFLKIYQRRREGYFEIQYRRRTCVIK
jgi:hypothetical protein